MKHAPAFLALVNDAKSRVKQWSFREVKQRLDSGEKFTLVDVREGSEWARGHLPGAIHLGKGVIERDIETSIPENRPRSKEPAWRISLGPGGRQSPENGLHQLHFNGRRLAFLDRSGVSHGKRQVINFRRALARFARNDYLLRIQ